MDQYEPIESGTNWRTKTMVIGGVVGALVGVVAAYMLIQRAEAEGRVPSLSAGEGVKVGLGLLGVMRLIADIGNE